jgi:hypothetical protein
MYRIWHVRRPSPSGSRGRISNVSHAPRSIGNTKTKKSTPQGGALELRHRRTLLSEDPCLFPPLQTGRRRNLKSNSRPPIPRHASCLIRHPAPSKLPQLQIPQAPSPPSPRNPGSDHPPPDDTQHHPISSDQIVRQTERFRTFEHIDTASQLPQNGSENGRRPRGRD